MSWKHVVVLLQKKQFECNCKHRQETNTRQHNATLGHNEQETQIQKPNERINMVEHEHTNEKMKAKKQLTIQ
jgi:hypothetical protein